MRRAALLKMVKSKFCPIVTAYYHKICLRMSSIHFNTIRRVQRVILLFLDQTETKVCHPVHRGSQPYTANMRKVLLHHKKKNFEVRC